MKVRVGEVMSSRLCVTHSDDDIRAALERMRAERVRRLPVVDDGGHVEGMLPLADIVAHLPSPEGQSAAKPLLGETLATIRIICSNDHESEHARRVEMHAASRP